MRSAPVFGGIVRAVDATGTEVIEQHIYFSFRKNAFAKRDFSALFFHSNRDPAVLFHFLRNTQADAVRAVLRIVQPIIAV